MHRLVKDEAQDASSQELSPRPGRGPVAVWKRRGSVVTQDTRGHEIKGASGGTDWIYSTTMELTILWPRGHLLDTNRSPLGVRARYLRSPEVNKHIRVHSA